MTPVVRRAALGAALASALAGCPDRETPRSAPVDGGVFAAGSPVSIGSGGDVAQLYPPLDVAAATPAATSLTGDGPRALAALDDGGAMYARTSGGRVVAGVLDPRGLPVGSAFDVGAMQGEARAVAIAPRGGEAMVAWSAARGPAFERLTLQRVQRDGARVGPPIMLGAFRVAGSSDAGVGDDALGFGVHVAANALGWVVAARGPFTACNRGECHGVRVVQIDASHDTIVAGSGVENPAPSAPVVLLAPHGAAWNAVLTLDAASPRASIAALGSGAFARLAGAPLRAPLAAAWIDASGEPAALLHAPSAANSWWLLTPAVDGGQATHTPVSVPVLRCDAGASVVELTGANGARVVHRVRADAPGGDGLAFAAAYDQWTRGDRATATRPEAVVATSEGLLVWTSSGVQATRCDRTAAPTGR